MEHKSASANFNTEPYIVTRADQMETMASPHRLEILTSLEASGPCSIPDLAQHLGRSPDSLYYHVKKMLEVGLLVQHGMRYRGGRRETVFDLPGRPVRIRHDLNDKSSVEALHRAFAAVLRLTRRSFRKALESESATLDGPEKNVVGTRIKGWLKPDDREEVVSLMERIQAIMAGAATRERDGELFAATIVLTPELDDDGEDD